MILRRILLVCTFFIFLSSYAQDEVYELRIYHLKFGTQEKSLQDYFEKTLIPALNRQGISPVGAFEEVSQTLPKNIYLLIPYKNLNQYQETTAKLWADNQYTTAAATFWAIPPEKFPYTRYESRFIQSTKGFPHIKKPADGSKFYELRTYEGYNEDALRRKLKMFNENEFGIFEAIDFPIVFFGKNISGDQMPSLTYLLATKDEAKNTEEWDQFGKNSVWQRISGLEEYANTVSNIDRVYLKPLSYSQL
ncbi:MAG: NIPSNAP family protein [Gillisia sp.]